MKDLQTKKQQHSLPFLLMPIFKKTISVPFKEPWVTEDMVGCFAYKLGLKVI
jgi:hypothetical protein